MRITFRQQKPHEKVHKMQTDLRNNEGRMKNRIRIYMNI